MTRDELRHLVRAACTVTSERHVLVMGSQAILGSWKEIVAPARVTLSNEADLAFFADPEEIKADTVMGVQGLDSQFHQTFGVYADGIASDSPTLAPGWESRLIPLVAGNADEPFVGWCLDAVDLCASKMAAGRPKDHAFVEALVTAMMVDPDAVVDLLDTMAISPERCEIARGRLSSWRATGWDADLARWNERKRQDAIRDLRRQCPVAAPPKVEPPLRCQYPVPDGTCRQLKGRCVLHPQG